VTVVVGVAAPDGIILAADSRSTWFDEESGRARIVSDNAIKVFSICSCAIATYGYGFIGAQSIAGHIDEFVAQLDEPDELEAAALATELGEFFGARFDEAYPEFDAHLGSALGFLIAGYNEDGVGHLYEVQIPSREVTEHADTTTLGAVTRGTYEAMDRLIHGIDWAGLGGDGEEIDEALTARLANLRYHLILPGTVQDAIDFAMFIIGTTIDMQRFTDGTVGNVGSFPTCGGPIRVLAVTRGGAEWIADRSLTASARRIRAEGEFD
jgi:hypothetical protein